MPAIAPSQATAFKITVLDGPFATSVFRSGDPPGVLNLQGRELPYRPYTLEGEQRVKTTYYAGNPDATQQLMGPMERNTVIKGGWHDPFLGNAGAHRLARIFDDLRRTGSRLRVEWGHSGYGFGTPDDRDEIRVGIIKRFQASWDRPQDIQWECEFEWAGRGEPAQAPTTSSPIQNPREGFVDTLAKLQDAVDAMESFVEQPLVLIGNLAFEAQEDIDRAFTAISSVNGVLIDAGFTINDLSALDNDTIEKVRSACIEAVGALSEIEHALLDFQQQGITVQDLALGRLSLEAVTFDTLRFVGVAKEAAAVQASSLAAAIAPTVIAELRPVPGTDLRDLAREFYGDPDAWRIIAAFNGLASSRVPAPPMGPSDNPAPPIRIPRQAAALDGFPC